MDGFEWDPKKDRLLILERGVSFEQVVSAIEAGRLADVREHPNQVRYPGQLIYVVELNGYMYLVPFVRSADGSRFLKTIIPNRKATRDYRSQTNEAETD